MCNFSIRMILNVYILLSLADPPTITILLVAPNNRKVLRGSVLNAKCNTNANPDAHNYHFYFNGKLIGNSSSGVFNVTVERDGVLTCIPINTVGSGDNASVSVTAVGEYMSVSVTFTEVHSTASKNIYIFDRSYKIKYKKHKTSRYHISSTFSKDSLYVYAHYTISVQFNRH